jgi:lipoprotein NlpD
MTSRMRMKNTVRLGMLCGMNRIFQRPAILASCLLLAACGTMRSSVVVEPADDGYRTPFANSPVMPSRTPIPGGSYVVAKGDTLYSIAFRKGVDFRDLAQWNRVSAPYTIWPGQRLTLSPAHGSTLPAEPPHVGTAAPLPAHPSSVTASSARTAPAAGAPVFEPVRADGSATASMPTAATHVTAIPARPAVSAASPVVPVAGVPVPVKALPPPAAPASLAPGPSRAVSGVKWAWPADGTLASRFRSGDAIPGIEIAGKPGAPIRAAADGVVVYSGNGLVGYGELVIIKHNDSFLSAYGHNSKRLVKEGQRVSAGQVIAEMGSSGASRTELEFQIRKDGNPVDPLGYLPPR